MRALHFYPYIFIALVFTLFCTSGSSALSQTNDARFAALALYDGGTLWGGQELFILTNGVCFTRVTRPPRAGESGMQERRCKISLDSSDLRTLRELLDRNHFFTMTVKDRDGIPDETRTTIHVRLSSGKSHDVSKWTRDPHADFDPIYNHLLGLVMRAQKAQPVYEGKAVYRWKPEGFE